MGTSDQNVKDMSRMSLSLNEVFQGIEEVREKLARMEQQHDSLKHDREQVGNLKSIGSHCTFFNVQAYLLIRCEIKSRN